MRSTSGIGTDERRRRTSARGDLLGPLVDRAGREDAARAERLEQHAAVEQRREPVRGRVADVDRRPRRGRARSSDRRQPLGRSARTPPPSSPARARRRAAHQRRAQPVGILVEVLERHALRAEEAAREDVVAVAADLDDRIAASGRPRGRRSPRRTGTSGTRCAPSAAAYPSGPDDRGDAPGPRGLVGGQEDPERLDALDLGVDRPAPVREASPRSGRSPRRTVSTGSNSDVCVVPSRSGDGQRRCRRCAATPARRPPRSARSTGAGSYAQLVTIWPTTPLSKRTSTCAESSPSMNLRRWVESIAVASTGSAAGQVQQQIGGVVARCR